MATVLIVDDSSFIRKQLSQAIKKAGHQVVATAKDGQEGFERYQDTRPDVVVMDITMRGTDGLSGASMIRAFDPQAKIVFMTLVTDPEVKERATQLGATAFLHKNDTDKLLEILTEI